jgi:hypothetical protein
MAPKVGGKGSSSFEMVAFRFSSEDTGQGGGKGGFGMPMLGLDGDSDHGDAGDCKGGKGKKGGGPMEQLGRFLDKLMGKGGKGEGGKGKGDDKKGDKKESMLEKVLKYIMEALGIGGDDKKGGKGGKEDGGQQQGAFAFLFASLATSSSQ